MKLEEGEMGLWEERCHSWVGARVKWVYGRKSTRQHRTGVVFLVDFSPKLFASIGPM